MAATGPLLRPGPRLRAYCVLGTGFMAGNEPEGFLPLGSGTEVSTWLRGCSNLDENRTAHGQPRPRGLWPHWDEVVPEDEGPGCS